MPLEQAQYIDSLTPEWPLGSDPRSAGDDHIRMIKQVLQNTFPNVAGAVTADQQQLNDLATHFRYEAPEEANLYKARLVAVNDDYSATIGIRARALAASELADPAMHDHVMTFNAMMGIMFPVGHVLVTSRTENPSSWLGFGTWTQRAGVIYGAGMRGDIDGMAHTLPIGDVPGYWRVHNEHIFPVDLSLQNGSAASAGEHSHTTGIQASDQEGYTSVQGSSSVADGQMATSAAGAHTHGVSGIVRVGVGTLPYTQPGHAFNVWERTA